MGIPGFFFTRVAFFYTNNNRGYLVTGRLYCNDFPLDFVGRTINNTLNTRCYKSRRPSGRDLGIRMGGTKCFRGFRRSMFP